MFETHMETFGYMWLNRWGGLLLGQKLSLAISHTVVFLKNNSREGWMFIM
jgi:hypothetical protein